jgi:uncharacterized protein YlxW (UPF0749 family)
MALVAAVWIAGYVVQKTVSLAVSFAWTSISSAKQGQEAYEERKRRLDELTASDAAAKEAAALRAELRRLQAVVDRLEGERCDLIVDQR